MKKPRKKKSKLTLWYRRKKRARAKAQTSKQKKPVHIPVMNIVLVVIAIALLLFTLEMIRLYKETGMIPDTLCTCVFTALGGECGAMAWIKTSKERNKERRWEVNDRQHSEAREDAMIAKEEQTNAERHNNSGENLELPPE